MLGRYKLFKSSALLYCKITACRSIPFYGSMNAGLDHILDVDTSSGEADTEVSTDESDSDDVSITDITCDFNDGLKLEHAFPLHMHAPRLRVYSASTSQPSYACQLTPVSDVDYCCSAWLCQLAKGL